MTSEKYLDLWQGLVEQSETSIHYWMHGPVVELTEDLSRRMKEQKISRAELARRMGTSRAYITKLLSGDANFTLQTMVKLALAVGGVLHLHISDKDVATRWQDKALEEPQAEAEETDGEEHAAGQAEPGKRQKGRGSAVG
jgi:transcriptional regulator with XRE-family HTH domain